MKISCFAGIAVVGMLLLFPAVASAQYVTYYTPYPTSYYYDPMTGATVSYASPYVTYAPGPRVYGPGHYYTYSPFYYSPSYYSGSYYASPGYYYTYPETTYYRRTLRYWR